MGMPQASTIWTAERVRALPNDGKRYELVSGELLVTPSPAWAHQRTIMALIRRLDPYVRQYAVGDLLTSPADLSLGEEELLQPDLFVAAHGPRPSHSWTDIKSLILAIEVLSPSTARYDRLIKRRRYQRARVAEYWIVDLDARVVERWRPEDERPEVLSETLEWRPEAEKAAMVIDLPAFFAEAWGDPSP